MARTLTWMTGVLIVALGCNDAIDKSGVWDYGKVSGTVQYSGELAVKEVGFAVFRAADYPPTTIPPIKTHLIKADAGGVIQFPLSFEIEGLSTGDYFLEVYGDIDTEDTLHGPNMLTDPYAANVGPLSIRVDDAEVTAEATLLDPAPEADVTSPGDLTELVNDVSADGLTDVTAPDEVLTPADVVVAPQAGKAALYGTVAWDGSPVGTLTILGFATSPPSGAPTLIKYVKNPVFPQFYSMDDVKPGTYYLIVYLDTVLTDGMTNQPVDPVSAGFRGVVLQDGDSVLEDFWLNLL